jgi:hypothetical protein
MRVGGMGGAIGLDLPALALLARSKGYDPDRLIDLLAAAERGMLAGLARRRDDAD